MKLLALGKPIKKPPRSDERDGELFCGTETWEVVSTQAQLYDTIVLNKSYKYLIFYAEKYGAYVETVLPVLTQYAVTKVNWRSPTAYSTSGRQSYISLIVCKDVPAGTSLPYSDVYERAVIGAY